jgi:O-antigen ligase
MVTKTAVIARAQPAWSLSRLLNELPALLPGLLAVGLMLLWAGHDGGFDADTWYWGALVLLSVLTVVATVRRDRRRHPRVVMVALGAFTAYVAWSYLSLAWAQAPGTALQGSNRALLYLVIFALMIVIPWTVASRVAVLVVYATGVGAIALVLVLRLAGADHVEGMFAAGRLVAPTGYINSNAALFTIGALLSTVLASRRELPGILRGLLMGGACASLQLAVVAQSRGWLFTLPLVLLATTAVVPDRLRFVATAALPALATLVSAHHLVAVFSAHSTATLHAATRTAGREALVLTTVVLVMGTILAWIDGLRRPFQLSARLRRGLGAAVASVILLGAGIAATAATHGDPTGFIDRQWQGFSHPPISVARGSNFATIGSGRYDFWRVGLRAFLANPIGGLGQDNFEDYYLLHRHTKEEPLWTHSLEVRLLAHTGAVGFLLFALFLVSAGVAAARTRRSGPPLARATVAAALIPATVWLLHGSIDWFWEIPALTGPALGFLAMAGSLSTKAKLKTGVAPATDRAGHRRAAQSAAVARSRASRTGGKRRPSRALLALPALVTLAAATLVLTLPYLSVREVSMASDVASANPEAALRDLQTAADLNPLSSDAPTRAGLLALSQGENVVAKQRFAQAIQREPGAWLAWLGAGLAESGLGERQAAAASLRHASSINNQQPPITVALRRVFSSRPLTYAEAIPLFVIVP